MEVSTATDGPQGQPPLIATLALRFAEICRLLAAVLLLMISVGALKWMVGHASYVIGQEMTALKQLKGLGDDEQKTAEVQDPVEHGASGRFMYAQVEVPIISGVASISMPPLAWLIFCVVATILIVAFVVYVWQSLITLWVTATSCIWSSFLAGLGCFLQWVWAIIATIITVVITLLAVICVIYNIVAFIAAL